MAYDTNPLCNVLTCGRLSPDSKVVDIGITNRDNVPVDVKEVYDLEGNEGILLDIPRTNSSGIGLPGKRYNLCNMELNVKCTIILCFMFSFRSLQGFTTWQYW